MYSSPRCKIGREQKRLCGGIESEEAMSIDVTAETELNREKAIEVLGELYSLLEDYGPAWYSEHLHYQAEAALRALKEQPRNA
jgi:uncharacterized protein (UPF0276 family)